MPNSIKVLTVDAAGTLIQPWPSVGAVYGKTARKFGVDIKDEEVNERFYKIFGQAQKNGGDNLQFIQQSRLNILCLGPITANKRSTYADRLDKSLQRLNKNRCAG